MRGESGLARLCVAACTRLAAHQGPTSPRPCLLTQALAVKEEQLRAAAQRAQEDEAALRCERQRAQDADAALRREHQQVSQGGGV